MTLGSWVFFSAASEFLLIPSSAPQAPAVAGMSSSCWVHWKARLKTKAAADMIALKMSILRWLGSLGASAPASLVYLPSLMATCENYEAVSNAADSNCKRLDPELDLSADTALLGRLVCSALTSSPPGLEDAAGPFAVETKSSVPAKLRIRVASLLQRSQGIGGQELFRHVVHLVRQGLRDHETVQIAVQQLALVLAEKIEPELLVPTAADVLHEVEAVFFPDGGQVLVNPASSLSFRVYGSFARHLSEQPSQEGRALALRGAPRMLALLAMNDSAAQDILEALSGLVSCMVGAIEEEYRQFVPLLDRLVTTPKAVVRREVLRWSTTLFPASAPEGRYYALRLFNDLDPDISRSAETALAGGGREVPRFDTMCSFLAARAVDAPEGGCADRLQVHCAKLAEVSPELPPLASNFTLRDVARAVAFVLRLADAEGIACAGGAIGPDPPQAKRPRLADGAKLAEGTTLGSAQTFVALLDYLLADAARGGSAAVTEAVVDGESVLELGLRGLLLAAALAASHAALAPGTIRRSELLLLGRDGAGTAGGTLFREGGSAASRTRRLGARVLGAVCELGGSQGDSPLDGWLSRLEEALGAGAGSAQRAGAVLTACELLRTVDHATKERELCAKALGLLMPGAEEDSAVLAAACDGLRRLSERRRLALDVLESGAGGLSSKLLLERLHELSRLVTGGLGDTKEAELGAASRDLVHASWRLLGQLAAWGGQESADCVDRLVAIGLQCPGEEALAALGLALAAAISDPSAAPGRAATGVAEALFGRVMELAGATPSDADEKPTAEAEAPSAEAARKAAAERDANRRCGIVWLTVLLRRQARGGQMLGLLAERMEDICRACVQAVGGLSIFVADCGLKAICYLYSLVPPELRAGTLKMVFSQLSNRTWVSNMFVGTPDTKTRQEQKDVENASGPNSLKIAAKERVDLLKDLMFLARELGHPPLFVALLDQPAGSVWTGPVLVEALDLQAQCLPEELQDHLCPAPVRPKLYPYFFHSNAPLRQAVIALSSNYFGCETPQRLATKYQDEWRALATNLISALGTSRVSTREAAVQAAQVLFRGRTWDEVAFLLEDFFTIVVKLMDDMETKIQAVVKPLVRMTRNLILRLVDPKAGKASEVDDALKLTIPLLLQFCERYKHATPLCFDIMREMVKSAHGTVLMSPYVQDLIPPLLISLSMMENDQFQYYQMHIDKANEEKGKELAAARVSASRDSESMKLLRQLVPLITAENAERLAPRTRDSMHRGVGANTRVGACDFWVAVCAERPSAVPESGAVATGMLRSVAGAMLDGSKEVRDAAASCFASLARRNSPQELTKVVFERLLQKDQDYRTDDAARSAYRVSLSRALWEVWRRCSDETLESELRAAVAAKAFGLRWSGEKEVQTGWEALWNEICPTTASGVERYHKEICAELSTAFEDSVSRAEKVNMAKAVSALCTQLEKIQPRRKWVESAPVAGLHGAVLAAVGSLPVFDGSGELVRALADLVSLMHRRERGEAGSDVDDVAVGLPVIKGFCSKGSLSDRAVAVKALMQVTSAVRLWGPLEDVAKLYEAASQRVDELQAEVEAEEREPGEAMPVRHRGKGQSPAEELLGGALDLWAATLQQCRREVDDEGDLEPPESAELGAFASAGLAEFHAGSLFLRVTIVRLWRHVFQHLAQERIALCDCLDAGARARVIAATQGASLDQRSERLRRPALELAAALARDAAPRGGREALRQGCGDDVAEVKVLPLSEWLEQLDARTVEQEAEAVAALRALGAA